MTTAQHTPAPWVHDQAENMIMKQREDGTQWLVAQARSVSCSVAERDANARLIAAAPDLLAALVVARDELTLIAADEGEHYNNPTLNDAIAKATGAA